MDVTITKGERVDTVLVQHDDGHQVESRFPTKGPLPHDAIHYIVETEFGLTDAFWGKVAAGHKPEEIQAMAKAAGHASATRALPPEPHIIELLQAERLVECVESAIWGRMPDAETFRSVAGVACESSHVPLPDISDAALANIERRIADLQVQWAEGNYAFTWPPQ